MNRKGYPPTWLICIMFALWFLIIPAIIGIILLIVQILENRKLNQKYGKIDELNDSISRSEMQYNDRNRQLQEQLLQVESDIKLKQEEEKSILEKREELLKKNRSLLSEIKALEAEAICKQYLFSAHDSLTSEECKNRLVMLKQREQDLIRQDEAVKIFTSRKSKKEISENKKQIIRCFNSECDNILLNLSTKNMDANRGKVVKSYETLNKIFIIDGIEIARCILELKLEQLNLVYNFELKKDQEREQQKAIKEQMIEEEKVRREIEKEKAKLEKDQMQCSSEINKLLGYMQKTESDVEKQLYIDKIKELEEKLKQLERDKETVLEREANARAGYVYVISNIGSFGENIYKIGMTRRLEPMDRVKELSSASVPFEFDVHAMIFSDDAPSLETSLHQKFEKRSVNRVNLRKEFFNVTLDEIEAEVKEKYNNTAIFTKVPIAKDYNQTLAILEQEKIA